MWVEDWAPAALCREADPDDQFGPGPQQRRTKRLCVGCPVRTECLAEALDNQIQWGVWGGTTERERRVLLRRTDLPSWRAVLESARDVYDQVPTPL